VAEDEGGERLRCREEEKTRSCGLPASSNFSCSRECLARFFGPWIAPTWLRAVGLPSKRFPGIWSDRKKAGSYTARLDKLFPAVRLTYILLPGT
jgi:hypothetical protein